MSIEREEVMELRSVGFRFWVRCDGCREKTGGLNTTTDWKEEAIVPPTDWAVVSIPYDFANDVRSKRAFACPKCQGLPAGRLLELAGHR